ncbi:MAG: tRNA (adenosine(37)-N6)-dimethylallyltransferase MiaA [Deltaproteobacteria bacterium]|nr:tRNA (adenosine(37)-N6)-dimethylallyltransferase MiaA [Deltaproteobacteria bacterium]
MNSIITSEKPVNLIVILGPTASGKTKLAARLAKDLHSEIISADSRQVYRGMDIGTGKDLSEYVVDGINIPFHLIDIVDPAYEFNVFEYQRRFFICFSEISSRGMIPIMAGGTGLYIESVLKGYRMLEVPESPKLREELEKEEMDTLGKRLIRLNPASHNTTDLRDRKRLIRAIEIQEFTKAWHGSSDGAVPLIVPLVVGIYWERSILRQRITHRLEERLQSGMIDEVKNLHASGIQWEKLDYFGLEYRYVGLYLRGILSYKDMFRTLNTRIHQFAKRQETWFRRMEKRGIEIRWINGNDYNSLKKIIQCIMKYTVHL